MDRSGWIMMPCVFTVRVNVCVKRTQVSVRQKETLAHANNPPPPPLSYKAHDIFSMHLHYCSSIYMTCARFLFSVCCCPWAVLLGKHLFLFDVFFWGGKGQIQEEEEQPSSGSRGRRQQGAPHGGGQDARRRSSAAGSTSRRDAERCKRLDVDDELVRRKQRPSILLLFFVGACFLQRCFFRTIKQPQ